MLRRLCHALFPDVVRGRQIRAEMLQSYGVAMLGDLGLTVSPRGSLFLDPVKLAALESTRALHARAHQWLLSNPPVQQPRKK